MFGIYCIGNKRRCRKAYVNVHFYTSLLCLHARSTAIDGLEKKPNLLHANNEGADKTVNMCSLISYFVVNVLERMVTPFDSHKLLIL